MSSRLPVPFDHRVRRRILRCLHRDNAAHAIGELSADLNTELTEIRYHARVLAKWDKVKERSAGDVLAGVLFESLVADDAEVIALLISTEAEDEPQ